MYISGFDILICPICSQLYKKHVIVSSNSFYATYFSDSYTEGPYLPGQSSIIKCINEDCGHFLKISNLKQIASLNYSDDDVYRPESWQTAYDLRKYKFKIKDLLDCLSDDLCNTLENELFIRTQILWRYNDFFREDKKYELSDQDETNRKSNIKRLIEIKRDRDTVKDTIFLAELHRELADFDSCIKILSEIKNENQNEKNIKEKIFSQAKIRKDIVYVVSQIAIKKEYQCDQCGESLILFDLEKLNSSLQYQHFICKKDNNVFNDSFKILNPIPAYRLNKLQKLFKIKKPHVQLIDNPDLSCPECKNKNVDIFIPEEHECIKCGTGKYVTTNWFDN